MIQFIKDVLIILWVFIITFFIILILPIIFLWGCLKELDIIDYEM